MVIADRRDLTGSPVARSGSKLAQRRGVGVCLAPTSFPAGREPMKILVLCYEYPPIGGGGGRVAKSLAEEFVLRGHQVRVQTAALGWRSSAGTINGVHVFRTASGRRAPDTCQVHEMASYCATSFMPTLRHLRQWQPDV